MPRGRPRKEPDIKPSTLEERIARYLSMYVCMIPGCDVTKAHITDAINIVKMVKGS